MQMTAENLEARADHAAKIVLAALSSHESIGSLTLAETRQMCLDAAKCEFPALPEAAQGDVADRAQLLFIRMWGGR